MSAGHRPFRREIRGGLSTTAAACNRGRMRRPTALGSRDHRRPSATCWWPPVLRSGHSPTLGHLRSRQAWPVMATTVLALSGVFAVLNFTLIILTQDDGAGSV